MVNVRPIVARATPVLALLLLGCQRPQSALHVVVRGPLVAGRDFDRLAVEVHGDSGLLHTERLEGPELRELPVRFNFLSGPKTPPGTPLTLVAAAYWSGETIASAQASAALPRSGVSELSIELTRPDSDGDGGTDGGVDGGTIGSPCLTDDDCYVGVCVDGVCCSSSCSNPCDVCNLPESLGTCVPAPEGTRPPICAPYACDGTSTVCATRCTSNQHCAATHHCRGNNTCGPKKANGEPCSNKDECISGYCVDAVCCNSACDLPCDRCDAVGSAGTCRAVAATDPGSPSCAPYLCSGDAGTCASRCASHAQCATTAYCASEACVPQKANGLTCAGPRECLSGFCSDGYCCNSACTSACNRCNLPGALGICRTSPAGDPGNPSCSPYVCSGNSISCPAQCTTDAGCAPGYFCSSLLTCIGSVTALKDDFNDNLLSARWSPFGNIGVAETNMQLELTIPALDGGTGGIASSSLYDATGAAVVVELKQAPNPPGPVGATGGGGLRLRTPLGDWVSILVEGPWLQAAKQVGGATSLVMSASYTASTMRWLRIREANGSTFWEYSSDRVMWVTFASEPNAVPLREVYVELWASRSASSPRNDTYVFDNVNP